jgi:hypothetical protein
MSVFQKKIGRPEFLPVFYWCCAACLRGAMRENIGSVGAMRERDRMIWDQQLSAIWIFIL